MPSLSQPILRRVALLLAALGCYWVMLIYQLGAQWSAYEQYNYGWVVPFLCLFLLWERIKNEDGRWKMEDGRGEGRKRIGYPLSSILYLLAATWAVTRLLHEANPIWRLTSWALALEVVGLTLLVMRLVLGAGRWLHFAFPVCFFLVAVPWPTPIEASLTETLTSGNVSFTTELVTFLGIPALQKGNVIEVATGLVGVDDACSGIRSFQSTLMIALFFGELYRLTVARRLFSVLAGFLFAFIFNIGRTALLVYVASRDGIPAMMKWHDPAGVVILVGCFVCVWLFCQWMRKTNSEFKNPPVVRNPGEGGQSGIQNPKSEIRSLPTALALGLGLWFVLTEVGMECWYRSHEVRATAAQSWSVGWPEDRSAFRRIQLSHGVTKQLSFDSGGQCAWEETSGEYWQLVYFRWLPSRSLYARVRSQMNKAHQPEHCLIASGMKLVQNLGVGKYQVGAVTLALRRYVFEVDGRLLRVYYGQYEDSSPPDSVASYRQDTSARIGAALSGSRNYGLRILELAVAGVADEAQAEAAVQRQLAGLIVLGRENVVPEK